jgi:maltodextrin utilization protein YvdJ
MREFKIFTWQSEQLSAAEYPELIEAEKFYTNQLDQYYSKLQSLKFNNDKVQKKQILDELSDMDHQVKTMKRDLIQNPDDERIVHAIINFYQTKLEIMDMIITRTQEYSSTIL